MAALVVKPLAGARLGAHLLAWVRAWLSARVLWRLVGVEVVVLQGRVCVLRAVPLGVARQLVPGLIRCGQAFAKSDLSDALYDDLVLVLALGLGLEKRAVEALTVSLWDLVPVLDRIARVNGLQVMEAGRADLGKLLEAVSRIGTNSMPGSSAPPAGPGSTSTGT